jgi:GT2 family glycosyltransferase
VLAAAKKFESETGSDTEILVVDDGSTDDTVESLSDEFPRVRLITRDTNGGFAAACNTGFLECRFPLVALINNDVRIDEHYLIHQAEHFQDPSVFAVTAKVYEWDSAIFTTGGRYGRFRRGFWSVYFNYDVNQAEASAWVEGRRLLSIYAIGGFVTYDRKKLAELGGFNELLSPFHWEDVDLSYRGWKRGWEVRYEPRSLAWHRTSATINAHYKTRFVDSISFKNRLLFHWINIHSTRLLASHLLGLMLMSVSRGLLLDWRFFAALREAARQLPEVRRFRKIEREQSKRTDLQVVNLLNEFYASAPIEVYYSQQEVMEKHPESR